MSDKGGCWNHMSNVSGPLKMPGVRKWREFHKSVIVFIRGAPSKTLDAKQPSICGLVIADPPAGC